LIALITSGLSPAAASRRRYSSPRIAATRSWKRGQRGRRAVEQQHGEQAEVERDVAAPVGEREKARDRQQGDEAENLRHAVGGRRVHGRRDGEHEQGCDRVGSLEEPHAVGQRGGPREPATEALGKVAQSEGEQQAEGDLKREGARVRSDVLGGAARELIHAGRNLRHFARDLGGDVAVPDRRSIGDEHVDALGDGRGLEFL
jgi:hypothetical protein